MSKLLSIIIPTKNRYKYLEGCLDTLVRIINPDIEVIVQDNTEINTHILPFIKKIDCAQIKYYHTPTSISQTENSTIAVSRATGEYCVFIGDDDTITTELIDVVKYMKANNIQACVFNSAAYYWPDVVFEGKSKPALAFDLLPTKIKEVDAKKMLLKALKEGALERNLLAGVYHGIVHKKILDEIFLRTKSYFPGPSPDMANSIACLLLLDKYIYINAPLIISGVGYTSGAGMGQRGAHKGSLKDAKQLPKDAIDKWSDKIPKLWIGYTVWPESAEKALIAMQEEKYLDKLNYVALEARTFLRFNEYRGIVLKEINKNSWRTQFFWELFNCVLIVIKRFLILQRMRICNLRYVNTEQISLADAFRIVEDYYCKRCLKNPPPYFNVKETHN